MNRRTVFFIGLLSLVVVVVSLSFSGRVRPAAPTQPPVVVRPAPVIEIQQPDNVVFSFASQPALPTSLPVYSATDYTPAQLDRAVLNNLSVFSIPASPSSLIRSGTETTTWAREGADFSTTVSQGGAKTIVFHQSQARSKPSSTSSVTEAASQFITGLFALPPGVTLSQIEIFDGPFDGLSIQDSLGASVFQGVSFSYTLGGIPIVTSGGGPSSNSVVVDNLGIIRSATLNPPPQSLTPAGSLPIITKGDVIANLSQKRAAVVSGNNPQTVGLGGALTFRSFAIDKTLLVYAEEEGRLMPALLLHGTGADTSGVSQEATYFLWASPQTN